MNKGRNTKRNKVFTRGMSLVESLVAITILLIVTSAVMTTAQGSLRATYASRDQITAFYLAQEANEYIRNTRDTNTLADDNWNRYLDECVGENCTIDSSETPDEGGLAVCIDECENLRYDFVSNQYGYSFGDESQFRRYVTLEETGSNGGDELRVITTVEWKVGVRDREIVVESLIYNWN